MSSDTPNDIGTKYRPIDPETLAAWADLYRRKAGTFRVWWFRTRHLGIQATTIEARPCTPADGHDA